MDRSNSKGVVALTATKSVGKIDRFQVFGERRSGTNAVEKFFELNTKIKPTSAYGWKHGFTVFPIFPQCCLFIVVVREPFSWLKSFYAAPFEATSEIGNLSFPEFLRTEWQGVYTPKKSGWAGHGYDLDLLVGRGEELQLERHPITGHRLKNVVVLRNLKLASHLSLMHRGLNAVILRYEDFLDNRKSLLRTVTEAYQLESADSYHPVDKKVGPKKGIKTDRIANFEEEDRRFVMSQLDQDQEKYLEYL